MNNRHQEKILDDTELDMNNDTFRQSFKNSSASRPSKRKGGGGATPKKTDISIDHEYIEKVDAIESQNMEYVKEIQKLKEQKDEEQQKFFMVNKELEGLYARIAELETGQQQQENQSSEKQKQLEYEFQLKDQSI